MPTRADLIGEGALVWAINEECLPNFLTPRSCPRVAYHVRSSTTDSDRRRFFTAPGTRHALIIESRWLAAMDTTLYLYEFDPGAFELQDESAGYYVARSTQRPIKRHIVPSPLTELALRGVELRVTPNLWAIAEEVKASTLAWSLCRMANAQPPI